eukprot:633967-Pleurochrysis_carterae.AAC.1
MEDESTRLKGVLLLSQLLAEVPAASREVPQLLPALVSKLTDVSVAVRAATVEAAVGLLKQRNPLWTSTLLAALSERIMDPEERVRALVVRSVCDAAVADAPLFASQLREIGHRVFDKRPSVRNAAR